MKSLAPSGEELVSIGVAISKNPLSVIICLIVLIILLLNTILSLTAGFLKSRKRYLSLVSSFDASELATSNGSCSTHFPRTSISSGSISISPVGMLGLGLERSITVPVTLRVDSL